MAHWSDGQADRAAATSDLEAQLVQAALRCLGRFGLTKTSLDDVAREAGRSRTTVYRAFPGGKEALAQAVVTSEAERLFTRLAEAIDLASGIEDALVEAMTAAGRWIAGHTALQFVLAHEPQVILPHVSFGEMDGLLSSVSERLAPHLGKWLSAARAERVVEWAARLVLSHSVDRGDIVDVTSPDSVRRLVRIFVLPALEEVGDLREPQLAGAR